MGSQHLLRVIYCTQLKLWQQLAKGTSKSCRLCNVFILRFVTLHLLYASKCRHFKLPELYVSLCYSPPIILISQFPYTSVPFIHISSDSFLAASLYFFLFTQAEVSSHSVAEYALLLFLLLSFSTLISQQCLGGRGPSEFSQPVR